MDHLEGIYKKEGYGLDYQAAFLDAKDGDLFLSSKTQVIRLNPGKTAETREQYVSRILRKDPRFQSMAAPCAVIKGYSNGKWIFFCKLNPLL